MRWRYFVLLLAIIPLAFASCDKSQLLTHSSECSDAVYLLTSSGAPVHSIYVDSNAPVVQLYLSVRNYSSRPGYFCIVPGGGLKLYVSGSEVNSICSPVAPRTLVPISFAVSDVNSGTYIEFVTVYSSVRIPVVRGNGSHFFGNADVAVAALVVVLAVLALLYSRLR